MFALAMGMLAYFDSSLGSGELIKRTLRETQADNGLGLAAQLAYYFFLALFPALLFLIALASFLPAGDVVGRVVSALQGVAPPDVLDIIRRQLEQITSNRSGGILTFGMWPVSGRPSALAPRGAPANSRGRASAFRSRQGLSKDRTHERG